MKLLQVDTVARAREKLKKAVQGQGVKKRRVPLEEAFGGILAEDVYAKEPVPGFDRSTVDGYAVAKRRYSRRLRQCPCFPSDYRGDRDGDVWPEHGICPGECMYIPTGGMIPEGADAVVMIEYCELFSETETAVCHSVPAGGNIVRAGDDVQEGEKSPDKGNPFKTAGDRPSGGRRRGKRNDSKTLERDHYCNR